MNTIFNFNLKELPSEGETILITNSEGKISIFIGNIVEDFQDSVFNKAKCWAIASIVTDLRGELKGFLKDGVFEPVENIKKLIRTTEEVVLKDFFIPGLPPKGFEGVVYFAETRKQTCHINEYYNIIHYKHAANYKESISHPVSDIIGYTKWQQNVLDGVKMLVNPYDLNQRIENKKATAMLLKEYEALSEEHLNIIKFRAKDFPIRAESLVYLNTSNNTFYIGLAPKNAQDLAVGWSELSFRGGRFFGSRPYTTYETKECLDRFISRFNRVCDNMFKKLDQHNPGIILDQYVVTKDYKLIKARDVKVIGNIIGTSMIKEYDPNGNEPFMVGGCSFPAQILRDLFARFFYSCQNNTKLIPLFKSEADLENEIKAKENETSVIVGLEKVFKTFQEFLDLTKKV